MKKILFTLLVVITISTSYGQTKWHLERNNFFAEAAAEEYNLDDSQQEKVYDVRLDMMKTYMDSNKAFKAGDITKKEMQSKNREASQKFHNNLSEITGKTYSEMQPWLDEMREKMKK